MSDTTFDDACEAYGDPSLALLCRDLGEAPPLRAESSEIAALQSLYRQADYEGAFAALANFLERHGLSADPVYAIDRQQFRFHRKRCRLKQREVAAALNVTANAITQLETRNGYLRFPKLLIAADCFAISPRKIIIVQATRSPGAAVARLDQTREGHKHKRVGARLGKRVI